MMSAILMGPTRKKVSRISPGSMSLYVFQSKYTIYHFNGFKYRVISNCEK